MLGYHANEVVDLSKGPKKYAALSHCFRIEGGAYGKINKGLYRVHQFTKLEMFIFCKPEESEALHKKLLSIEKEICDGLDLPYRVIDIPTGDLGDEVVAVVARDVNVQKIKGHKAFHNENERKFILSCINLVDKAVLGDKKDVYKPIKEMKPDIILLGYDQINFTDHLEENLKKNNLKIKVLRTKPLNVRYYKTSKIKKYLNKFL